MLVKQWIKDPASGVNTLSSEISFGDYGAFRIGFQALPGTTFKINGKGAQNDTSLDITMGPTGIYELGFVQPLIKSFSVVSEVETNSVMILDALVAEATESESSQDEIDRAISTGGYSHLLSTEEDGQNG